MLPVCGSAVLWNLQERQQSLQFRVVMLGTSPYLIQVVKSGEVHRSPVLSAISFDWSNSGCQPVLCMYGQGKRRNETRFKGFLCIFCWIMVESFLLIFLQEHFVSKAEGAWHTVQALYFKEERLHNLKIKMDNILTELVHLTRNFEEI